ncbi:MAG: D-sedoheptulose 7-phosphate isomerase [Candidatus Omnitrophica bacterium]|nr:D-sedoheptulose 7-phosphate isomerase [Candidatus Omnitrophota bacterium]
MKNIIEESIKDSIRTKEGLLKGEVANIEKAARAIIKSLRLGGKVLIFGNGGSAADSQHMAAELVGRFKKERRALAAIALTANTSILTAIGNDYGYDTIFSRQITALSRKGDVAIGISTSGNSQNVLNAIKEAKSLDMGTIGLSGGDGGRLGKACDISIIVAAKDTPRVQESHITIIHILCDLIENELFK